MALHEEWKDSKLNKDLVYTVFTLPCPSKDFTIGGYSNNPQPKESLYFTKRPNKAE